MTLEQMASIGEIIAAVAVVVTLIYLSKQIHQANLLSRSQVRQRMVEHAQAELYVLQSDPDWHRFFTQEDVLAASEQAKFSMFLTSAMRQREWEWFQYNDGAIDSDVYQAYHGVIAIHLGTARSRKWWKTVGRTGFDPGFVNEVDSMLEGRSYSSYFNDIACYDTVSID